MAAAKKNRPSLLMKSPIRLKLDGGSIINSRIVLRVCCGKYQQSQLVLEDVVEIVSRDKYRYSCY